MPVRASLAPSVVGIVKFLNFLSLAFDVMKQTQGGHGISLSGPQTSRTPAAPARAPPRPGERGVTAWDESPSMLSPGSTTQGTRGGGPAHKSGSRAPSSPSTALNTSAPSLPTHPPRPGPRRAISGRAISGDLGAAPRYLGRSRAISRNPGAPRHATPPHPTSPTAAPRYLGRSRSVARAASHLLKKGRAWLEPRGARGRARSVLAAALCAT